MRVRVGLMVMMLLVGLVGQVGSAAQKPSRDVPMFRGNAARTGAMPGPGPDSGSSVERLWEFAGEAVPPSTSPAIVDGVAYVGRKGWSLYAIDIATGTERWQVENAEGFVSSPAVVDGVVYVGSIDGNLYALDAASGAERWRFATGDSVFSSPAIVDGVLYFGSLDGNLYALDAASGQERWRFTAGDGIMSAPAVVDGTIFVGGLDGNLYAENAATGEERWRFRTGDQIRSSPAVVDGVVYFGSNDGYLYAIDATDGLERWRFGTEYGSEMMTAPAVVDGMVYIGNNDAYLYAVDAASGQERWRFGTSYSVQSSPGVVDGVVYFASDGYLYALDAASGAELWRFRMDSRVWDSSPAVVDGVVYIGGGATLFAIGTRPLMLETGGHGVIQEETVLRGAPALTGVERATLEPGTVVEIVGDPETTNGETWWPVRITEAGAQGWVSAGALEPAAPGSQPESPSATAQGVDIREPVETAVVPPAEPTRSSLKPTPTAAPPISPTPEPGGIHLKMRVSVTEGPLNLRAEANTTSDIVTTLDTGAVLKVLSGPEEGEGSPGGRLSTSKATMAGSSRSSSNPPSRRVARMPDEPSPAPRLRPGAAPGFACSFVRVSRYAL